MANGSYKALSWPITIGSETFFSYVDYIESVHQSVLDVLTTPKGTRRMRPSYGVSLWKFVFETNSEILNARIRQEVKMALYLNEPRVTVISVTSALERILNEDVIVVTVVYELSQQYYRTIVEYVRP